jgi:hypothetical protein
MLDGDITIGCKWDLSIHPIDCTNKDVLEVLESGEYSLKEGKDAMCWKILVDKRGLEVAYVDRTPSAAAEIIGKIEDFAIL